MATKLNKPVVRVTHALYRGRPVIVELRPPDMFVFRLKGLHAKYPLTVAAALDLAFKVEANHLLSEKKKAREQKKLNRGF